MSPTLFTLHAVYHKDFIENLKKEEFAASLCGLKFPRHHPLFEIYDQKLQQIFSGQFLYERRELFNQQWTQWRLRTIDTPKVLNMKMLEPGFVIWTLSLLLAVAAFIFEWLVTLKDFLVMQYILEAFYTTRRQKTKFKQVKAINRTTNHVTIDIIIEEA